MTFGFLCNAAYRTQLVNLYSSVCFYRCYCCCWCCCFSVHFFFFCFCFLQNPVFAKWFCDYCPHNVMPFIIIPFEAIPFHHKAVTTTCHGFWRLSSSFLPFRVSMRAQFNCKIQFFFLFSVPFFLFSFFI